jgi:peptidoglycan hydrolase-like protein with peptidoglycan-binding domain
MTASTMTASTTLRMAALTMTAVAAMAGVAGCKAGAPVTLPATTAVPAPQATAPSSAPAATSAPGTASAPTTTPPAAPASAPARATASTAPSATGPLRSGSSGPAVLRLQQRLTALGYWLGTPDGDFGTKTQQAVFALQKAAGLSPSGTITTATQKALDNGVRPTAKSSSGHVIEVNLARNLLLFVTGGHVTYTLNTSTGGGYVYYDQGQREVATTPKGHFTTYRVIDGPHRSSLGLLIRPRYFTAGYAIHGDSSVPARPVSHGCVRVTDAAIDWIWAANLDPIGTPVWIY